MGGAARAGKHYPGPTAYPARAAVRRAAAARYRWIGAGAAPLAPSMGVDERTPPPIDGVSVEFRLINARSILHYQAHSDTYAA